MRSCLLALTWLGAVLLVALQRGGSARAAPSATRLAPPRLARALQESAGGSTMGARYPRNRGQARPVLLDEVDPDEEKRQFDDYGHMRFGKRGPQAGSSDDYGHMRFGKRGPQAAAAFDDYGHMRFGRAGSD